MAYCLPLVCACVKLYCPKDEEDDAFHRCIYVFCCPKAACVTNNSVKALRCQLPRRNPFYFYEPDDVPEADQPLLENVEVRRCLAGANPSAWGVSVCMVCGQSAKSTCSKCGFARYCGKDHQALHWKKGHRRACAGYTATATAERASNTGPCPHQGLDESGFVRENGTQESSIPMPGVFRPYEVEVRPEESPDPGIDNGQTVEDALASKLDLGERVTGDRDSEEDAKLSQAELDKIAGVHGVKDKLTLRFLCRTQANPQVVRYDSSGGVPLWSSSNGVASAGDVPPCGLCGAARKFEFQVMPHLLHHLGTEAETPEWDQKAKHAGHGILKPGPKSFGMDWGTLAVYTCPKSCAIRKTSSVEEAQKETETSECGDGLAPHNESFASRGYVEEFVWRQPPP